jgi:hypothetical protein
MDAAPAIDDTIAAIVRAGWRDSATRAVLLLAPSVDGYGQVMTFLAEYAVDADPEGARTAALADTWQTHVRAVLLRTTTPTAAAEELFVLQENAPADAWEIVLRAPADHELLRDTRVTWVPGRNQDDTELARDLLAASCAAFARWFAPA